MKWAEPSSNLKQLQLLITLVEKAEERAGSLIITASEGLGRVTQAHREDGDSPSDFAWLSPYQEFRWTRNSLWENGCSPGTRICGRGQCHDAYLCVSMTGDVARSLPLSKAQKAETRFTQWPN